MDLKLKNKTVLITAAGQGLGKAIAEAFLIENADIMITDLCEEKLKKIKSEFERKYPDSKILTFAGDFTNRKVISECVIKTIDIFHRIDVLIPNLGSGSSVKEWNPKDEEWDRIFDLNFNGARLLTNCVVPQMIKQGGGSITYISSIAGIEIIGAPIAYSVAKSCLITYSKNLSRSLGQHSIRVNSVCPGNIFFNNGTWDKKMKEDAQKVELMLENSVPLKRFATPNEIANLVVFLASDLSSFITGSCIISDGGQTISI